MAKITVMALMIIVPLTVALKAKPVILPLSPYEKSKNVT